MQTNYLISLFLNWIHNQQVTHSRNSNFHSNPHSRVNTVNNLLRWVEGWNFQTQLLFDDKFTSTMICVLLSTNYICISMKFTFDVFFIIVYSNFYCTKQSMRFFFELSDRLKNNMLHQMTTTRLLQRGDTPL